MSGLLHLGAMAALTGAVYLNLDKAEASHNAFLAQIERLRDDIKNQMGRLDQKPSMRDPTTGKMVPSASFRSLRAMFLLYIANEDRSFYRGWINLGHAAHKAYRAPGLNYFTRGWHKIPVGILTVLSTAAFIWLVAISIAHKEPGIIGIFWMDWVLFWLFTLTVVGVFAHSLLSHQLEKLEAFCRQLLADLVALIEADIAAVKMGVEQAITRALADIGEEPKPE